MITACKEHVEFAIDEFVDTYEEAPELRLIEETTVFEEPRSKCKFCGEPAAYLLTRADFDV
ncbi:CxxH/CxxC protein [Effusibacillus lacus]|uniref:CxxH/CxxC protein n=1 Tax=Effusibacillus lacus TaxID=1348429 RepID=A0A292YL43_9BACL|nr:CxxH/CxxC protein [Effusibacillus lacus]TCS75143.1 CxxH/CxxC protein (TIGR04129 family) [Effusibacillus lacus]GAX89094.1 CxxH/CxxC protein [Effusibacillus lacus]